MGAVFDPKRIAQMEKQLLYKSKIEIKKRLRC